MLHGVLHVDSNRKCIRSVLINKRTFFIHHNKVTNFFTCAIKLKHMGELKSLATY